MSEGTRRTEIRLTGFGGQGVVLSGYIIGRACAINAGLHASMIQSFGPEARGSACSATLTIQNTEVLYPYIGRPSILMALSSEAYHKYADELAADGVLIYEKDLVDPVFRKGQRFYGIPSTRIAEEVIGRKIVQNIVMLGFFTAATEIISREEMRQAVLDSVPAGTEELNLKAFDAGVDYFEKEYGSAAAAEGKVAEKA